MWNTFEDFLESVHYPEQEFEMLGVNEEDEEELEETLEKE